VEAMGGEGYQWGIAGECLGGLEGSGGGESGDKFLNGGKQGPCIGQSYIL
jgi:hypothetical protein